MKNFIEFLKETSRDQKAIKAFKGQSNRVKTMAIMSPENPMGKQLSVEENKILRKKFEDELKNGHFAFKRVKGLYNQVEHSYIIFNVKLKDVMNWCSTKEYNQESFFYCVSKYNEKTRQTGMYYTYYEKPANGTHKPKETTDIWNNANDYDDYYTQVSRKFKFSIPLKIFEDSIDSYDNYLDERMKSWDENENGSFQESVNKCIDENQVTGFNAFVLRGKINCRWYDFEN